MTEKKQTNPGLIAVIVGIIIIFLIAITLRIDAVRITKERQEYAQANCKANGYDTFIEVLPGLYECTNERLRNSTRFTIEDLDRWRDGENKE